MEILSGTKRQITLMQWDEILKKAEKRLEESKECFRRYGDEDSRKWIKEDTEKVNRIKEQIEKVILFMDEHNIK